MWIVILLILLLGCHGNCSNHRNDEQGDIDELVARLEELLEQTSLINQPSIHAQLSSPQQSLYGPPLRIGAFNIQMFGKTKASKPHVMQALVTILLRYDVVLIQEIRDSSETAILDLLEQLNSASSPNNVYSMAVSTRLGRTSSKEQYAFFYRSDKVEVVADYQYKDTHDWFERPPYIVRFSSHSTELADFAIVGCHIKPTEAPKEIDRLVDVYEDVMQHWNIENVLLTGDFNADCSYVTRSEMETIRLRHDKRFTWLTGDDVDTTVARASCAYDRLVVAGKTLANNIVIGSAKAFRFDLALGLSVEEAEDVSDHFPVELQLVGKVDPDVKQHISSTVSFSFVSTQDFSKSQLFDIVTRRMQHGLSIDFVQDGVAVVKQGVVNVVDLLQNIQNHFPNLIHFEMIELTRIYIERGILEGIPSIPGFPDDVTSGYDVTLTYFITAGKYTVTVSKSLF